MPLLHQHSQDGVHGENTDHAPVPVEAGFRQDFENVISQAQSMVQNHVQVHESRHVLVTLASRVQVSDMTARIYGIENIYC